MKKFISFALTAAMVASLVPATAFAKTKDGDTINGTVSVVNAWNENKKFDGKVDSKVAADLGRDVPEVQIRVGDVDMQGTDAGKLARFAVRLDNANFFDEDDVDTAAGREAKRVAFNDAGYIQVRLNPNGVVGDSTGKGDLYTYKFATEALEGYLSDYYDAITVSNSGNDTTHTDGVANGATTSVTFPTGLLKIAKTGVFDKNVTGDEAGTKTGSAVAAASKPVATDTDLGTTVSSNAPTYTAAKAEVPKKEVSAVRQDVLKAVTGNSSALETTTINTANGYLWTEDLAGIGLPFAQAFESGTPGWVDYSAATLAALDPADAIKAADAIKLIKGNPAHAALVPGVDGTDGFKEIPVTPATDGFYEDKDDWTKDCMDAIKALTDGFYTESSTVIAGDRPIYGFARKGLTAYIASEKDVRANEITITVENPNYPAEGFLEKGDIISVDLVSVLENSSRAAGVSVTSSDFTLTNDNADFTYVNVDKEALVLSTRKVVDVAEDEVVTLDDKGLKITTNVGTFRTGADNQVNLKISKGFEFVTKAIENKDNGKDWDIVARLDGDIVADAVSVDWDTDKTNKEEITLTVNKAVNEITIYGIDVKAASAKISKVATIRATSNGFNASAAVEVAKVVDYIVALTVDEDEDVPVIYSGVDVNNTGLTDDSDHWSLEVTAKESFPGAWSFRKGFNFELPDHVFVTDVEVVSTENFLRTDDKAQDVATPVKNDEVFEAFFNAYQNGSHVNFEFDKRVFDDVDAKLTKDPASMTFKLQLVADTGFEGDAVLKLTGELVDEQEVTIAKFVKPYEVKAEQNDIIIDYRYTDIPTAITITEAEGGLWDKGNATFRFKLENHEHNFFEFEGDPTFEVDSKSDMALKSAKVNDDGMIQFTVDAESDEAATIEIKGMQLFMNRSIPAGPYDLLIESSLDDAYHAQMLFAPDAIEAISDEADYRTQLKTVGVYKSDDKNVTVAKEDSYVGHVEDCTTTVKEAFVNVVTAGRDQDDASFTTKVVVPVGEDHIFAGEKEIKLDTPAYINEAGYTMLPIRAVAVALGINSNNVLWDQPTKTVTILYGQRIITMTQGQKVVYVNGSAIPASAAVENTNSRTFLPMRDLATALGVTDITWDQASRTATLNGNQK